MFKVNFQLLRIVIFILKYQIMTKVFDHECTLAVQYVTQTHHQKTTWQTDDRQQIASVKVSKSRKEIMMSWILPKNERNSLS